MQFMTLETFTRLIFTKKIFLGWRHYLLSQCVFILTLFALLLLNPPVAIAQNASLGPYQQEPNQTFLPFIAANEPPVPLLDLVWQRANVHSAPGSRGIQVIDWDEDGKNELLIATETMLSAFQHQVERENGTIRRADNTTADYQLEQIWAVELGTAWGVADVIGDEAREVWMVQDDGQVLAYSPYEHEPHFLGVLFSDPQITILDVALADLYGTGENYFVVLQESIEQSVRHLTLYGYKADGLARTWQFEIPAEYQHNAMIHASQTDDDPAQEIIMESGLVIDPAQSAVQWAYEDEHGNKHFGRQMYLADVDQDGRDEIVGVGFFIDGAINITAFDVGTRSVQWQLPVSYVGGIDSLGFADINNDTIPEVLVGEAQWGDLKIYDGQTRTLLRTIENPEHGITTISVGDINHDAMPELMWGAGNNNLYIHTIGTEDAPALLSQHLRTHSFIALQLDDDAAEELVLITQGTGMNEAAIVYDGVTGLVEPIQFVFDNLLYIPNNITPFRVNIDDDSQHELLVSVDYTLYLFDHNGEQLHKKEFPAPSGLGFIRPKWVGDIDSDLADEIVIIYGDIIYILDAGTLDTEWESSTLPLKDLAVGNVDDDDHLEMVFHGNSGSLQAYDGQTKMLEWQIVDDQRVEAVGIGDLDNAGPMEIVYVEDNTIKFYDPQSQIVLRSPFQIPYLGYPDQFQIELAHLLQTDHPQILLSTREKLYVFYAPWDAQPIYTFNLLRGSYTWSDLDGDQYMDLLVGNEISLGRYRARFASPEQTPPTVGEVSPLHEATLVSRNNVVEAQFSEAMASELFTTNNAQLRVNNAPIPVELSYDPETYILRLTSTRLLPADQKITVWLSRALGDLAGNRLDGNLNGVSGELTDDYSWHFTTDGTADELGPIISQLQITPSLSYAGPPLTLMATVNEAPSNTSSTIRRVEYTLDESGVAGEGVLMDAEDGRLNESQEEVTAILDSTLLQNGQIIYVRAEDSIGNWGAPVTTTVNLQIESPANWPMFGQNAGRTNYNPYQTEATNHTLDWEVDVSTFFAPDDEIFPSQVVIADGVIVVPRIAYGGPNGIVALDVQDGSELWRRPIDSIYQPSDVAIAYGRVYFQQGTTDEKRYLLALDLQTGEVIWQTKFPALWYTYAQPTVVDGQVFLSGGSDRGLISFDAFTGEQLWTATMPLSISYAEGTVYSWLLGDFSAWDAETGIHKWTIDVEEYGREYARPIISGTTAYAAPGLGIVAVDLETQSVKWHIERPEGRLSRVMPAIADNVLYDPFGSQVRAFDLNTQELLASFDIGDNIGTPVITADNVYVPSAEQTWSLDRETLEPVWSVDKGGWLAVANDQLFIMGLDKVLSVYSLK